MGRSSCGSSGPFANGPYGSMSYVRLIRVSCGWGWVRGTSTRHFPGLFGLLGVGFRSEVRGSGGQAGGGMATRGTKGTRNTRFRGGWLAVGKGADPQMTPRLDSGPVWAEFTSLCFIGVIRGFFRGGGGEAPVLRLAVLGLVCFLWFAFWGEGRHSGLNLDPCQILKSPLSSVPCPFFCSLGVTLQGQPWIRARATELGYI